MWIFRFLIPGIVLVALGIFLGSNLDQKTPIQFLNWELRDVPLILIVAITLVAGIFIRYYVILVKWLNKKQMKSVKKKILATHESEKTSKVEKEHSKPNEKVVEDDIDHRIYEDEDEKSKDNR